MPAMHVKAKESDRLAIESSDLPLMVIMSSKMKVASQLWTDWTDCVMDWIGWMVTLKAICGWDGWDGWDGWVILYTVTPRASLQSDANNSSLDSKEVTLYLHRGGLGNNWPGIGSPRILSSSSGRHHNRQPIVNSVHLGLITRWSFF